MPVCPQCGARNPKENTTCRSCGAVLGLESAPSVKTQVQAAPQEQPGEPIVPAADQATAGMETSAPEAEESEPLPLGRAVLFGVGAAILLGAIWYVLDGMVHFQWAAIMVLVIGWLIGFAVSFGTGRRRGRPLQWISLGLTAATILVVRFALDGWSNPAGFPLAFWQWLQADPITLIAVLWGLWQAFSTPGPRPKQRRPEPQAAPAGNEPAGEGATEPAAGGEGQPAAEGTEPAKASTPEDPTRRCARCQAYIPPGQALLVPGGFRRGTLLVCPKCREELTARFTAETENVQMGPAGLFGAGAAALIGVIWYFVGRSVVSPFLALFGFAAGWILPEVIRFGAGKKRGRPLQWLALGLTFVAIAGANIALAVGDANGFLAGLGTRLGDPLTDVIYLLSLFQAYTGPAPRRLGGILESEQQKQP